MTTAKQGDILVYIDNNRGFFVGRVESWKDGVLTLLLADQSSMAADMFYRTYFYERWVSPPVNAFYAWPNLIRLTFTRQALPGQWKRIEASFVMVATLI